MNVKKNKEALYVVRDGKMPSINLSEKNQCAEESICSMSYSIFPKGGEGIYIYFT